MTLTLVLDVLLKVLEHVDDALVDPVEQAKHQVQVCAARWLYVIIVIIFICFIIWE